MNAFIRFVLWVLVIGGAICGIGYYAFFDVWTVPGDDPRLAVSIQPTLMVGDVLLVKRHSTPVAGDLLRCADPDEPRRFVVGRMAVGGGSSIRINGQHFSTPGSRPTGSGSCPKQRIVNPATGDEVELACREEEFAGTSYQTFMRMDVPGGETQQDVTVPTGKAFLMSDDRYLHLDSRDFGSVDDQSCQHLVFRLWSSQGFLDATHRFNIIW